tara:strand:- start:77 stop:556 length:480 start_codon:yes stop_codon:yes gene_type:complete
MIQFLQNLQKREQLLVSIFFFLIITLVIPLKIIKPIMEKKESLNNRINHLEWSLTEIKHLKKINSSSNASEIKITVSDSLVVIVDRMLRKYDILSSLQRSQPIENNEIRIDLTDVSFNKLIIFLSELKSNFNLDVKSANFTDSQFNESGLVNASISLIY